MKQTMQKIAIALCMALAFAACKNDDPETGGGVESVAIDKDTLSLVVNDTATLQVKINDVVSTEVEWKSDRPDIATVVNGKVTAKKEGTAKITATAKADKTKTVTCTVTVKKADITVTLDQLKLTLGIGKDATLKASINDVVSTEVTWSSDKPDIAEVDNNGKVTAKKEGSAIITATAKADETKKVTCTVTVEGEDVAQPSGIKVSPLSLSLKVGDTEQVTATIDNENELDADHKKITWTSSKESVATVSDTGLVTAVSVGEATITATTTNNKSATCIVTVTEPVTITLAPSELTLEVGKTKTLVPTITGTDSKTVTWKSSDEAVATVADGTVTAKKKGEATITVTLTADTTKTATCKVTVVDQAEVLPSGVTLNKSNLSLKEGSSETLTATITNADAVKDDHKKITWTSSNESVATVNNGLVTAVSAGTATITATTTNGKTAECTVTVTAQASTTVTASDDAWDFVKKVNEAPYNGFDEKTAGNITSDISIPGKNNNLTLVLSAAGTGVGNTTADVPKYKYQNNNGLCIKNDALKIDNVKGVVKVTIEWYLGGSSDRDLEVTVGNGKTIATPSGTTVGDKTAYTDTFDAGEGTTLYIGASNELYIKSITIEPQSGGTVTPPPTTTDPDPTDKTISLTDKPLGYASKGTNYATTGTRTEVSTRAELVNAIKQGGVIIIDGMIDMSEGKLPAEGSKSTDSTTALDTLVHNTYSKYANYAAWVKAYSEACSLTTEDDTEYNSAKEPFSKFSDVKNSALRAEVVALNKAYGDLIKLTLKSGTTLIGKGANCGIRGGSIQISNASNIQIRNLTIQDAFDPFPHHEVNSKGETDGYNAQWDGINIQNTCKNIWIDHVTFEDTITLDYVYTSGTSKEKWQTYDGLCDMKNDSTNITISNCVFRNHDKTMLIGSSDTDGDNSKRFVTLQGNYFFNCGQRLPMVRNTTIHILNNYYDASNPTYSQQYAVGCRKDSIIYAEANYFGSGIYYSFKDNDGELHSSGNTDNCQQKSKITSATDSKLFKDVVNAYTYTPVTAEQAKTNAMTSAGAGYTLK